eukprot:scaffold1009_cov188-Alexandrium_tamarense.AAC.10
MSPAVVAAGNNNTTDPKREVDGKALAIQLGATLLELGLTLTASYCEFLFAFIVLVFANLKHVLTNHSFSITVLSKWIAKKIQGGQDGGTMEDLGINDGSGGSVATRLKRLLDVRHEATLKAMMEELEDHQSQWKEQQKNNTQSSNETDQLLHQLKTEQQFEALSTSLQLQHQQSLSHLSTLSPHELSIAQSNIIDPSNISVTFADIGGMDGIKSEIYDLVVLPLVRPDLFMSESGLVSPPKGILLYGPPGTGEWLCILYELYSVIFMLTYAMSLDRHYLIIHLRIIGKTMLAKAIAKESHATFVNVQLSSIMNKWFGESNKLISATFNLARKLAPSVVFIDEMDAFLSQRDGTEGSAVNSMKSEFLTLWDGLLSERKSGDDDEEEGEVVLPSPPIIVLGATNRPYDVDPAILRRLPRSFEISLPDYSSRLQLLNLFLEKQRMTEEAKMFIPTVAQKAEGYSGSDLKELCRAAAWEPVRELTSGASRMAVGCGNHGNETEPTLKRTSSGFPPRGTKARPVNKNDFLLALQKVKRTGESARHFHKKELFRGLEEREAIAADISKATAAKRGKRSKTKAQVAQVDMQQLMAMAMAAMNSVENGDSNGYHHDDEEESGDDEPPEMFVDANS